MVWKKGKNKKIDSLEKKKLRSVPEDPKLKSCLKYRDFSDQESSQDSSRLQGGAEGIKSDRSRSVGSRCSGESGGSGSSSVHRWRVSASDQGSGGNSVASYASSERGSRISDHGPPTPTQNSDRSSPSVTSQPDGAKPSSGYGSIRFRLETMSGWSETTPAAQRGRRSGKI
jgi:hypothetical protein